MTKKHYIVNEPGDGDILVSDDSGSRTHLEDDICLVYGGNDRDYDQARDYADRIAALLNLARGIPTQELTNKSAFLLTVNGKLEAQEIDEAFVMLSALHEKFGFSIKNG